MIIKIWRKLKYQFEFKLWIFLTKLKILKDGVIGESGEMRPVKRAKENWWNENLIDEDKISKPSKDKPLYYDLPKGIQ